MKGIPVQAGDKLRGLRLPRSSGPSKEIDVFLRITVETAAVAAFRQVSICSFAMTFLGVFFCIAPVNPVRCSQCMDNKLLGVIAVFAILKGGNGELCYWFNIRGVFISDNHYKVQLTFCRADIRY